MTTDTLTDTKGNRYYVHELSHGGFQALVKRPDGTIIHRGGFHLTLEPAKAEAVHFYLEA